jgi:uncharacterized protein (TIGR01777 family)
MKIAVTGGTGFLGQLLIEELLRKNNEVVLITRQNAEQLLPSPYSILTWPLESSDEIARLKDCDAVINLAGESIAGARWTAERKEAIRTSRVSFTHELVDHLRGSTRLKTFLSSSAMGFYGDRKSEVLTEENPVGEGFLAEVCRDWEREALTLSSPNVRVALLRTGIVLGRGSGFLDEIERHAKLGTCGVMGSGEQFMSWIHVQDWVQSVVFCLENSSVSGAVNLCAPEPVTNKAFSHIFGKFFSAPVQMPVQKTAIKLALGEMSVLALDSQNMRPEKLQKYGYKFRFPYLQEALIDLYEYTQQNRQVHEYFTVSQWIPAPLEKVFAFFSDVNNLEKLSPPVFNFKVQKKSTEQIMSGTLIDYKLKIHGVPIRWRTQIEKWSPPHMFSDSQMQGPYTRWHHSHTFEPIGHGTLMKDHIHYRLPLGVVGRIFGLWLVKKDLSTIFTHRRKIIREEFN